MNKNKSLYYEDKFLTKLLLDTNSIAVVGLSEKENRPSFFAAKYLKNKGYRIIPINPITKNKTILDEKVYKSLHDLNYVPDMIDIFVKQDKVSQIVNEAIKVRPKVIWLQLGLVDFNGEIKAKQNDIAFIMNRCPKIEYARLSGELGWAGVNSGLITNKRIIVR